MGRLKYRASYGQNLLSQSAEVARLAGIMAREVGLDAHVGVRAAFVHDIGKAIDREMEGTHLQIGIDFLRKQGGSEAGGKGIGALQSVIERAVPRGRARMA